MLSLRPRHGRCLVDKGRKGHVWEHTETDAALHSNCVFFPNCAHHLYFSPSVSVSLTTTPAQPEGRSVAIPGARPAAVEGPVDPPVDDHMAQMGLQTWTRHLESHTQHRREGCSSDGPRNSAGRGLDLGHLG